VSQNILLDAGPLGLLTNPKKTPLTAACQKWLRAVVAAGYREVRRELMRAQKVKGLAKLDALGEQLQYIPLTTTAMRQAAAFWAQARQQGQPLQVTTPSTPT
jgi:hypothetical protein